MSVYDSALQTRIIVLDFSLNLSVFLEWNVLINQYESYIFSKLKKTFSLSIDNQLTVLLSGKHSPWDQGTPMWQIKLVASFITLEKKNKSSVHTFSLS